MRSTIALIPATGLGSQVLHGVDPPKITELPCIPNT